VIGRRAWILSAAAALACSRSETAAGSGAAPSAPGVPSSKNVQLLDWDLGVQGGIPGRATIVVPSWGAPEARFPVLIALHGRGEALKPPSEGAMGWPRDYAMVRAIDRLRSPPLRESDYMGFADPRRVAETNASLAARPFGGLVVACPWMPDFDPAATADIAAYSHFVTDVLLRRVQRETPAIVGPEATGIDGVSLGGIIALRIGLTCPEFFGAVGGIQPAVARTQSAEWCAMAQAARARRPTMKLHLVTSHEDYFREAIVGVSQAWRACGVAHDFLDVPGPHDYSFNRGPGSIELLLWHDRALAH
jgi:iron(III)-salmochelin esterase